jgi:hypothetical protein
MRGPVYVPCYIIVTREMGHILGSLPVAGVVYNRAFRL